MNEKISKNVIPHSHQNISGQLFKTTVFYDVTYAFRVNLHSLIACQGTPCSKHAISGS